MKKQKTKPNSKLDRIVLAEGYPWVYGLAQHFEIVMWDKAISGNPVPLKWTEELWQDDVAKYRLVLERI